MNRSEKHRADSTATPASPATAAIPRVALLFAIYLGTRVPALVGFAAARRASDQRGLMLAGQERWDG